MQHSDIRTTTRSDVRRIRLRLPLHAIGCKVELVEWVRLPWLCSSWQQDFLQGYRVLMRPGIDVHKRSWSISSNKSFKLNCPTRTFSQQHSSFVLSAKRSGVSASDTLVGVVSEISDHILGSSKEHCPLGVYGQESRTASG